MELIYEKEFAKGSKLGANFGHIDRRGKILDQSYIFVSLDQEMVMLEFLMDEVVEDEDRKVQIFEF